MQGRVYGLNQVSGHPLAEEIVGEGVAILPYQGVVVAPFDGKITKILPNHHVLYLTSNDGLEVLIHIGINSKKAEKDLFQLVKHTNDDIQQGEVLLRFDPIQLQKLGIDLRSFVIYLDHEVQILAEGEVGFLEPLFREKELEGDELWTSHLSSE